MSDRADHMEALLTFAGIKLRLPPDAGCLIAVIERDGSVTSVEHTHTHLCARASILVANAILSGALEELLAGEERDHESEALIERALLVLSDPAP